VKGVVMSWVGSSADGLGNAIVYRLPANPSH
jgi:hypothetical protein